MDCDDLEGWYEAAQKVAWNRDVNEAFIEMSHWTVHSSAYTQVRRCVCSGPKAATEIFSPTSGAEKYPPPSKSRPAPMDIDVMIRLFGETTYDHHPQLRPLPPISEGLRHCGRISERFGTEGHPSTLRTRIHR
jgi:hypothetical protein